MVTTTFQECSFHVRQQQSQDIKSGTATTTKSRLHGHHEDCYDSCSHHQFLVPQCHFGWYVCLCLLIEREYLSSFYFCISSFFSSSKLLLGLHLINKVCIKLYLYFSFMVYITLYFVSHSFFVYFIVSVVVKTVHCDAH